MKSSSVRGTPVRSATLGSGGQMAGKPSGMLGTSPSQYVGDQSNKVDVRSGTPYNSVNGNPADARRVVSSGPYGDVIDTQTGVNFNTPESNGNGVVLDGVGGPSLLPADAATMDSPVPAGAQRPIEDAPATLAKLRSGHGSAFSADSAPSNNFQDMGGVMSRDITEN